MAVASMGDFVNHLREGLLILLLKALHYLDQINLQGLIKVISNYLATQPPLTNTQHGTHTSFAPPSPVCPHLCSSDNDPYQ